MNNFIGAEKRRKVEGGGGERGGEGEMGRWGKVGEGKVREGCTLLR